MTFSKLTSNGLAGLVLIAASIGMEAFGQSSPSPVGDWYGVLYAGEQQTRTAIHLEQRGGKLAGDIDLPDTGQWDVPLEKVVFENGILTFSYRGGSRRFEGRWDPARNAWVGRFHNPNATFDVSYSAGFLGLPVLKGLEGYWEASAVIQGYRRSFKFRVVTDAHGTHAAMDIPEIVQTDVAVTSLSMQDNRLTFAVPSLGVRFEGLLAVDEGTIRGGFRAGRTEIPLTFIRDPRGAPRRVQTPAPPFPYSIEETEIANPTSNDTTLGCTLNVPKERGPHPAAILLSGTGQQDRDETLLGHKPFAVIADHLARNGMAVLRCDDRGVGASKGDYQRATLDDFAGDVEAVIGFLQTRGDIAEKMIGLIGHSEGGIVASLVAIRKPELAFVIQMAGPGLPVHELLLLQGEEVARAEGMSEAQIDQQRPIRKAVLETLRQARDAGEAQKALEALFAASGAAPAAARMQAAQEASPDILRIIKADPAQALAKVRAPLLLILGSKDRQVPAKQNIAVLRTAVKDHADATVQELANLNHMFQTADTGAVAEYYSIEETVAPQALKVLTDWLANRELLPR